jgi:outer membrane protein assembly factor BamE (lipoprotein component of BamABCDE complex)
MPYQFRRSLSVFLLLALCSAAAATPMQNTGGEKEPVYQSYKGVKLGMTADEVRKALGSPENRGDTQDFYSFSDDESAQVFYDADKKVYAVSVFYTGGKSVPTAKAVLGAEAEPKPDGSAHRMVEYPKAGYWVAYSRTAGDSPLITVTMQKRPKGQ